jgi:type IV pilus assembly protein PilF
MKFFCYALLSSLLLVLTACSTNTMAPVSEANTRTAAATALNPTAANYNVQLGVGYLQQGDVQRAKQKLLLALDQAPTWAPAQDAMAYYLENTGDDQGAEKYHQRALDLDPKSGAVQNNYGTFLCRTGHYQAAVQHFILATQDPQYLNTAEAYENAGLCARKIPDDVNAAVYLQKAIQQDPRRANAYLELAQISFNQNNYSVAQQYLDHYAALTPNMGPEGLWLGIRLARQANDNTTAGRYVLILQSKYPNSVEYRQLKAAPKPVSKTKTLMY